MMKMSLTRLALILTMIVAANVSILGATSSSSSSVEAVIASLRRLLDYFRSNYQDADVDTAIGLRVIEGQTKLLVEEYEQGKLEFVDDVTMKKVSGLGAEAGRLANMVMPHVHESDRKRFVQFRSLVEAPFKFFHPHRVVNPSLRWAAEPARGPASIDAKYSRVEEECFAAMMLTTPLAKKSIVIKCSPTANCLRTMLLTPSQNGHRLQRQIFYTILIQKNTCERQVNEYLVGRQTGFRTVEQIQHELCTNAYYEFEEATASRMIPADFRNLFLEMEFFCPSVGYFQFMKMEWLQKILSWQTETGCFPSNVSTVRAVHNYSHAITAAHVSIKYRPNVEALQIAPGSRTSGDVPHHFIVHRLEQQQSPIREDHDHRLQLNYGAGPNWRSSGVRWPNDDGVPQNFVPQLNDPSMRGRVRDLVGLPGAVLNNRALKSVDGQFNLMETQPKNEEDSCQSHFTAMASKVISLYLRYLLDPGPPEFVHLRLDSNYLKTSSKNKPTLHYLRDSAVDQLRGPTIARPKLPIAVAAFSAVNVSDMLSKASNFMGTYQRQWSPRFQPIDVIAGVQRAPDHIRRADVTKVLSDWTVSLVKSTTSNSTSAKKTSEERRSVRLQIIEIHPLLQRDFDNYLVVVVLSVVCLFAFLRYFGRCRRRRRPTILTAASAAVCKARNL